MPFERKMSLNQNIQQPPEFQVQAGFFALFVKISFSEVLVKAGN